MEQRESAVALNLNYNGLTEMDFEAEKYARMECIYLKRNLLKYLSPSVGSLQYLVQLHVVSNNLDDLPDEIGNLPQLEVLDVSDNKLTCLPTTFGQLQSLQQLRILDNNFQHFPEEICNLKNLKVLEASRNNFRAIPPDLCQCINLTLLALDKNSLTSFPRSLLRLRNLKELSLCGNKLRSFPQGVWKLDALVSLYLDNNPLLTLPMSIHRLPTCNVGVYSCFALHKDPTDKSVEKDIHHLLLEEMNEICMTGESCVPCLQELAARSVACNGNQDEYRQNLPLPVSWLERLCEPIGTCEQCQGEMFVSSFPVVMQHSIIYYGLFCSLQCVIIYKKTTQPTIKFPVYNNG